ncbi:MAG: efflux RND transporter periplasmic adaptor subunit [Alphaproteobacteria bacterium]
MNNEINNKINLFLRMQKERISAFLKHLRQELLAIQLKKPALRKPALVLSAKTMPRLNEKNLKGIVLFQSLLLVGGISFGGWFYWTKLRTEEGPKKRDIPQMLVEALPVELGTFETFVSVVGTLRANESIVIRPEIEGVIKEVRFKSGDSVAKGDILFVLEDGIYRAVKKEAQARVDLYKGKYERAKILYERKAGTLKEQEEMFAQLTMAQAELDKANKQLKKATIRAPFKGVVGFKAISPGAYVRPGEDLVTLDDLDPMSIEFRVAENMLDKLQMGKTVQIEVDGFPDNIFEGTIEAVDSNVDPMGHSIRVRALLGNKDDLFKPGLFGKVKILVTAHEDVIMVPESAVESRGSQEYVYRVEDGKARYTPVKTGGRNGEKVEILAGLQPGQTVIVAGQMKVQDKWPVMAVPPYVLKRL